MTDMDYKQKYKEALTWVESIYHELSHDRQMEAEAFFPELKDSEDEKIRKEILSFCQGRADNYPNAPMYGNIRKWIAWLEKQGQRPQITWKPNEKQIKALRWVLQNIPYNTYKEEIYELSEQLKRQYELLEQLKRRKENKV